MSMNKRLKNLSAGQRRNRRHQRRRDRREDSPPGWTSTAVPPTRSGPEVGVGTGPAHQRRRSRRLLDLRPQ
ncbi:hypothetical protein QP028_15600 [Corynebacterium suedekumii]|nr:hypothetical protein QP028_15600 [Corynebacterium suedekumii]